MSGKNDGCTNVKNAFKDVESLKREEWHRRRLLRLEQVRQQSKDVATLVRQKVQTEREKQLGLVKERVSAQTQQWQVQKLNALHREYESTLQNVGKGHSDAAEQPNEQAIQKAEAERIMLAAQKRGQEALQRLRDEEVARRKVEEQRRHLLNCVRSVEESRSAAVVALPCPESTVGLRRMPSKKTVLVSAPAVKLQDGQSSANCKKSALPEWPKRLWPQQVLPLGIDSVEEEKMEQGDSARDTFRHTNVYCHLSKDKTSKAVSSEGDANERTKLVSKEQSLTEPVSKTSKASFIRNPGTCSSNADVKFFDFTSTYQRCTNVTGVVEKIKTPGDINAKEAADREFSRLCTPNQPSTGQVQVQKKRSQEALQRVQVQRDYRDLMGNLSALAKQNAALSAYSNQPDKSWEQDASKENQLILAVENLLPDAEVRASDSSLEQCPDDTPDGSLIVSRLGDTPGSGPRLNLGRWHPPDETVREVNFPKLASLIDSNIIASPPPTSGIIMSNRQESNERDDILRSLVQRINNERQLLLRPNQQLSHEVEAQPRRSVVIDHQYVRKLEERVVQQRQELEEQRSEVKRLDASIVVPDCVKQPLENHKNSSRGSSLTHESIIIEESPSEKSPMSSSTPSSALPKKLPSMKDQASKKNFNDVETSISSPVKDKMMYSMDVSLSSVIMDQTENDSSGSKSLSLHGVQVVVKVSGKEDASESLSTGYSDVQNGVEISEISSDNNIGIMKYPNAAKSQRQKKKSKDKSAARPLDEVQQRLHKAPCQITSSLAQEDAGYKRRGSSSSSPKLMGQRHDLGENRNLKTERRETKTKKKRKRAESELMEHPASTSTSYLSPPDRVLSSLTEDIKTLIGLAQANANPLPTERQKPEKISQNQALISYINRLLTMSRESIDRLNVSCSEISTPSSALFESSHSVNEASVNLSNSLSAAQEVSKLLSVKRNDQVEFQDSLLKSCESQEKVEQLHNSSQAADNQLLPFPDHESLMEMTKRCNENISILTRMIEEVRTQGIGHSPTPYDFNKSRNSCSQSNSPLPLDSTAYMSPPPQVLEWANIAQPPEGENQRNKRMSMDPYGTAVMQLIADIRSQMATTENNLKTDHSSFLLPSEEASVQIELNGELTSLETGHPKPPVAFWRNIERCNITSPTEPHELSTILELATTLPESIESHVSAPVSPLHAFSAPSSPGTPPDVIAELMRRNLLTSPFAWAKKMNNPLPNNSYKNSKDSELSSGKTGTSDSDICASKETNSSSIPSQNSNVSTRWQTNVLMSPVDLCSSADEVEGDLRRMGIGWMGAMLRKTKEAGALSSTSSSEGPLLMTNTSDYKDLSDMMNEEQGELFRSSIRVALGQSRGHSTPIKPLTDLSSSNGSHLV